MTGATIIVDGGPSPSRATADASDGRALAALLGQSL